MTNIDKEKVLAHLHLMQKDIEQIKRIISGSEISEIKEPPRISQSYPTPQLPTQPPLPPQTPIGVQAKKYFRAKAVERARVL